MNSKKLFENYWNNKQKIVLCEKMIEERKKELLPSMTPFLSHTPKGTGGYKSSVESTVLRWQEDKIIISLAHDKEQAEKDIETVDKLISVLMPSERDLMTERYINGVTIAKVAEKLDISDSKVIRDLKKIHERLDNLI